MPADAFRDFDATSPLAIDEHVRRAPKNASTKGLFLQRIVDEAKRRSGKTIREQRYLPFKDYPFTEWIKLIADGAETAYPRVPTREALRRLGHGTFETYRESMLGRVILSAAGNSLEATIPLVPKLYELSATNATRVTIVENLPGLCVVAVTDAWDFADSYQVGVLEGGFRALGRPVETRVRSIATERCDVEFRYR